MGRSPRPITSPVLSHRAADLANADAETCPLTERKQVFGHAGNKNRALAAAEEYLHMKTMRGVCSVRPKLAEWYCSSSWLAKAWNF
jgi:hypothetical protein